MAKFKLCEDLKIITWRRYHYTVEADTLEDALEQIKDGEENKVRYQIPTLHGYHLITIGFDVQQFSQKLAIKNMDPIDIQKDNPTLLYYATV